MASSLQGLSWKRDGIGVVGAFEDGRRWDVADKVRIRAASASASADEGGGPTDRGRRGNVGSGD